MKATTDCDNCVYLTPESKEEENLLSKLRASLTVGQNAFSWFGDEESPYMVLDICLTLISKE